MKRALILQGWYQKTDSNWYPWLKSELQKKDYEVFLPDLPTIHTDELDMQAMMDFIVKNFKIDENTVVFGHSIGAVLALRLAERYKFAKLFLVAGWDFNDLTTEHQSFWGKPTNHDLIKKNVKEIYCLSSDNDPYYTASTVEDMSKRLGGKFSLVPGAGHFTKKFGITSLPQVLKFA